MKALPGPALLFCPADRPDRYAKAAARADVVILDLEDAVAPERRAAAREAVLAADLDPQATIVRVNPHGSPDFEADVAAVARSPFRCVMLAKTETAAAVEATAAATGSGVLALVETPLGVVNAAPIAAADGCVGMMWGAEDLVAGMGGLTARYSPREEGPGRIPGEYRDPPRHARSAVALAAAAYGRWAVDAVRFDIDDEPAQRAEALDAVALGFAGTACIHPAQVAVIRAAYAPTPDQLAYARRVLAAAAEHGGVFRLDGRMIDGPILRQSETIVRRARLQPDSTEGSAAPEGTNR